MNDLPDPHSSGSAPADLDGRAIARHTKAGVPERGSHVDIGPRGGANAVAA